ncbi:MAG: ComF family protein [Patescibacteria group bacterium]
MLKKLYTLLLDLVFPLECVSCSAPDTLLCDRCERSIPVRNRHVQRPTEHLDTLVICSTYKEATLKAIITRFKYNGVAAYAAPLVRLLEKGYRSLPHHVDLHVVPIPLHKRKRRIRGYNQSEILARALCENLRLPIDTNLMRIRYTPQQSKRSREERLRNVEKAFRYDGEEAPRHLLLIDDVTTTFATLESAARELKRRGAETVDALVLAQNRD